MHCRSGPLNAAKWPGKIGTAKEDVAYEPKPFLDWVKKNFAEDGDLVKAVEEFEKELEENDGVFTPNKRMRMNWGYPDEMGPPPPWMRGPMMRPPFPGQMMRMGPYGPAPYRPPSFGPCQSGEGFKPRKKRDDDDDEDDDDEGEEDSDLIDTLDKEMVGLKKKEERKKRLEVGDFAEEVPDRDNWREMGLPGRAPPPALMNMQMGGPMGPPQPPPYMMGGGPPMMRAPRGPIRPGPRSLGSRLMDMAMGPPMMGHRMGMRGPPRPPMMGGGPPFMRPPPMHLMAPDPSYGKKGPDQEEMLSDMGHYCVPKNPVIILRDMTETEHVYDFRVEATDQDYEEYKAKHGYYPTFLYKCMVTVDDRPYFGCGDNKRTAKEKCAYAAIPNVVTRLCSLQRPKDRDMESVPFFSRNSEIPWGLLCGLAVHKMYEEWRSKGYEISQRMERDFRGSGNLVHASHVIVNPDKSHKAGLNYLPPKPPINAYSACQYQHQQQQQQPQRDVDDEDDDRPQEDGSKKKKKKSRFESEDLTFAFTGFEENPNPWRPQMVKKSKRDFFLLLPGQLLQSKSAFKFFESSFPCQDRKERKRKFLTINACNKLYTVYKQQAGTNPQ